MNQNSVYGLDKERDIDDVGSVDELEIDDNDSGDTTVDEIDDGEPEPEQAKDYKKLSVRETIKDAREQQEAKEKDEEKEPKKETIKLKDTTNKDTKDVPVVATTEDKTPISWSKEAKAQFNNLPPEVKAAIAKRETEVSEGFKKYGEGARRLEDLDKVFVPARMDQFKQAGISEAQAAERMFQWMEAIAQPNKANALQQWMALGKQFGLELPTNTATQTQKTEVTGDQPEIPEHLKSFIDNTTGKLTSLEQQLVAEKNERAQREQKSAQEHITIWAKDKPHFETVKPLMFELLKSGVIPLKDGTLDLDSAYDQAVHANPTTRNLVAAEKAEAARQAADNAAKEVKLKALEKANKARKASTLSTRAPTGTTQTANGKDKNQKAQSVRDSINAARREVSENN